jgi:hypothetical protein
MRGRHAEPIDPNTVVRLMAPMVKIELDWICELPDMDVPHDSWPSSPSGKRSDWSRRAPGREPPSESAMKIAIRRAFSS